MRPLLLALLLLATPAPPSAWAKTMTWSFSSDVLTLDPHTSRVSFTNAFLGNIYEPLVRMNERLEIEPALALSWERPSPTVWRFRLRPGVRFHNGDAFTADDVVFTWARLNTPGANRGPLSAVGSITAPDPMTVEIRTERPFPVLLNALLGMPIMGRAWAEANNAAAASDLAAQSENFATRHANGTGPFRIVSRQPDGPTVLEANASWWDKRVHDLDQVTFLPIRNAATRTAALVSGGIDATVELPLQDVDRVARDPRLQVIQGPELRTIYIGFDLFRDELLFSDVKGRNPLKDRRVREALYRAIDIAAIRTSVMRGKSWPAGFMASPQLTGAPQDLNDRLPYDPEAAKALLAEAGYPAGFGLGLTCPNDRYVNDERICQAISAMWTRIGVRTTLQSETSAVWSRRTANLDLSAFMLGHAALPLADVYSTLAEVIHGRTETAGGLNYGRYANPEVDRLIDEIAAEGNEAARLVAIRKAFALEKQDIANIPLHQQPLTWAARRGIDMHQAPDNNFRLYLVKGGLMDLLITGGTVVTMDGARRVIPDGAVAIEGARIVAVGPAADLPQTAARVIDARGQAIMPGLIDGHAHAGHGLVKTLAGGDSAAWSEACRVIYTTASPPSFWHAEARLAALERLMFGTTTGLSLLGGGDSVMRTDTPDHGSAHMHGVAEIGIRTVMAVGPTRPPFPWTYADGDATASVSFEQQLDTIAALIARWHGAEDGRLAVSTLMPVYREADHDPAEVAEIERQGRAVQDLGRSHGTLFHQDGHRSGSLAMAADMFGLLGPDAVMSHCTDLTEADIEAVVRSGTKIVHNPSAIASVRGYCPVPALLDRGVTVMLGSDGTAPDRSADMFRHMFQCMRLHQRHHRDERLMPPGKLLEMVTIDAARALGMDDRIGSLEPGKQADVITVDLRKPHLAPANMPVWRLACFANGQDVDTVVVDGRVLMHQRQVPHVDVPDVLAAAEAETRQMLDRTGFATMLAEPATIWGRSRH